MKIIKRKSKEIIHNHRIHYWKFLYKKCAEKNNCSSCFLNFLKLDVIPPTYKKFSDFKKIPEGEIAASIEFDLGFGYGKHKI